MKTIYFASVLACMASILDAAPEVFGTKEEARNAAEAVIEIIETKGITAAAQAIIDPEKPFRSSRLGINLFHGSVNIADNREPEQIASDFGDFIDLTGEAAWPRIVAAADAVDDVALRWYHYDTQEIYDYLCFSMRAERDDGLVMVCR